MSPGKGTIEMDKLVTMSTKELTRLEIMQRLEKKTLRQKEAAKILSLSERHIKRLYRRYREQGANGLVSKHRGKASNHQMDLQKKQEVIDLLHSCYPDFGPTLAREKLMEVHSILISTESVRQIMIAEKLWKPRKPKKPVVHQLRQRRACYGELVQIDGSPHDWFEGRGPKCNLLVFIDDATGRLGELYFTPRESFYSYGEAARRYITRYGKPTAFYSDKHGIFRVNIKNALSGNGLTQFGRAMKELDIEIICANTPQAKGRVERANQILQDRLVKEMRLRGISSIEEANRFTTEFREDYNQRFAVSPRSKHDAHRPLCPQEDLALILSWQEQRTLSKNLTLQYNKVVYQIQTERPSYALRKAGVTICQNSKNDIAILYNGKPLDYTVFNKQEHQSEITASKDINYVLSKVKQSHPPAPDHPWRKSNRSLVYSAKKGDISTW